MSIFNNPDAPSSKAFIATGTLPAYVDPLQPPSKKKPFSTIWHQPFTHTVELVLPEELYRVIWQDVSSKLSSLEYSRVIMSLSEVIDGDFFNKYIKSGNILMLSEGRPGIDDKYTLKDGHLKLDLGKETYERTGLVGKPARDGGRQHVKTRYSIEIDLRQPSMLHGKKGFERIVWAFKNVLNQSVTWLFHDFEKDGENALQPIAKHHPFNHTVAAQRRDTKATLMPPFDVIEASSVNAGFEDWTTTIYEWLGLISLQSPRIQASDNIDPYLSRYHVPTTNSESESSCDLVRLLWKAFVPASWIRDLFVALNDSCSRTTRNGSPRFFALSAHALKTEVREQQDGYTILWLSGRILDIQPDEDHHELKKIKQKKAERHGEDFVVWEIY